MPFYPDSATPLIIVGRQRAGTRFLTDALNLHDDVTVQGELPNPVMKAAVAMMEKIDAHYRKEAAGGDSRRGREAREWREKRKDLMLAIWANAGQLKRVEPASGCRYYGYKRPNNEHYFGFYEAIFDKTRPVYIYCVRNFAENYLSIVSRWPKRTVEKTADEYLASIEQFHRMREAAAGRVLLFNLDRHIAVGSRHLEEEIIRPLGLSGGEELQRKVDVLKPRNVTGIGNSAPRRRVLTAEEDAYIRARPALETAFAALGPAL